nr:lipoyl(octanoyl) transferase LipB [Kordiimonas pumila]
MEYAKNLEWRISEGFIEYPEALKIMEERVLAIKAGTAPEMVWLLEHPPLYTAGTSANPVDLVDPDRFPVYDAGRGGQYTYHGPGQRVVYFMLDLTKRGRDVRQFVYSLEEVMIQTLAKMGVIAERREGRVGVWVERGAGREDKIGAIGVRIKQWVTFHGIALNVEPDLSHFNGIVPCGISEHGVTSLRDLGLAFTLDDVDILIKETFDKIFGLETRAMTLKVPKKTVSTPEVSIEKTHPVFQVS